jgi:hypothetical protein
MMIVLINNQIKNDDNDDVGVRICLFCYLTVSFIEYRTKEYTIMVNLKYA